MTAEPQSTPDVTQPADWPTGDRADLLIALHAVPSRRWQVLRQENHIDERQVCTHRWEWVAELCARRRMARHAAETGVFYTARDYTDRWQKRILIAPERRELER